MHELALVQEMLVILERVAAEHRLKKVTSVTVKMGVLANVIPETIAFAFEALTRGTVFEGAALILEEVPVEASCQECGRQYTSSGTPLWCPECGSNRAMVLAGTELTVANLVGEEQ